MLAGHIHFYSDMQRDGLRVITTSSASAQLPEGESWGYNLCELEINSLKCEFKKVLQQAK